MLRARIWVCVILGHMALLGSLSQNRAATLPARAGATQSRRFTPPAPSIHLAGLALSLAAGPGAAPSRAAVGRGLVHYTVRLPYPLEEVPPLPTEGSAMQLAGPITFAVSESRSVFFFGPASDHTLGVRQIDWRGRQVAEYRMGQAGTTGDYACLSVADKWLFGVIAPETSVCVWRLGAGAEPLARRPLVVPGRGRPNAVAGLWGLRSGACYALLRYGAWPDYLLGSDVLVRIDQRGTVHTVPINRSAVDDPSRIVHEVVVTADGAILLVDDRKADVQGYRVLELTAEGRIVRQFYLVQPPVGFSLVRVHPLGADDRGDLYFRVFVYDTRTNKGGLGIYRVPSMKGSITRLSLPGRICSYPLCDGWLRVGPSGTLYGLAALPEGAAPGTKIQFWIGSMIFDK